jgi:hypothetical protein
MRSLRADAAVGNGRCGTVLCRRRRQATDLRAVNAPTNSDEKERVSSGHRLPHRNYGAVLACLSNRYARRPHTRRVTIGRQCNVGAPLVGRLREELRPFTVTNYSEPKTFTTKHVAGLNQHRRSRTTPLTNEEKRARVEAELRSDPTRSNRAIASLVGVGHQLVEVVRLEVGDSSTPSERKSATGKVGGGVREPRTHCHHAIPHSRRFSSRSRKPLPSSSMTGSPLTVSAYCGSSRHSIRATAVSAKTPSNTATMTNSHAVKSRLNSQGQSRNARALVAIEHRRIRDPLRTDYTLRFAAKESVGV